MTTIITGVFVASWALIGDAAETYDLTNIGTLFAFMLVSIGVLVLRYKEPDRPRPFRVPLVWPVCVLSAAGCVFIMYGLPRHRVGAVRHLARDRPRRCTSPTASPTASCAAREEPDSTRNAELAGSAESAAVFFSERKNT